LLQDLYIAEVYLGVDAAEDGRAFFRSIVDAGGAESDVSRLSAAVVLSQILLLDRRYDEYAELATETLAPLLLEVRDAPPDRPAPETRNERRDVRDLVGGLALLPLMSESFLAGLPDERLRGMVPRWDALRARAEDDRARLGIDLILEALSLHLGWEAERREAAERLRDNPAASGAGLARGVSGEMLESVRGLVSRAAYGGPIPGAPGVR
jgi:hypothetical protein